MEETIDNKENWDFEILPKTSLLALNLKEVWDYRDLLLLFTRRDFVAKYKQTILGPIWFFLQPLFTTLIFTVIFSRLAQISTDGIPPILFYLAGITCWNYFADCLSTTSDTFIDNQHIFGKVYFPRLVMPLSIVVSNLLKFGIQFLLFACFYLYFFLAGYAIRFNFYALLLPVLILILAGLGLGFGLLITASTTKYRDLRFLIAFGVQLWMYATPVIYPLSEIPDKYKVLSILNPITSVIETFKYGFLNKGTFSWFYLGYSLFATMVILILGTIIFNKTERTFMDTV